MASATSDSGSEQDHRQPVIGTMEVRMEYTHTPLDEKVQFVSGAYQIDSEHKLQYGDREILYLLGSTDQICGCCGSCAPIRFISVPGFIRGWKSKKNEAGLPVTEIDVVGDDETRTKIRKILQQEHDVSSVEFW